MTMINAYDSAQAEALSPDDRALIDRRAKALGLFAMLIGLLAIAFA